MSFIIWIVWHICEVTVTMPTVCVCVAIYGLVDFIETERGIDPMKEADTDNSRTMLATTLMVRLCAARRYYVRVLLALSLSLWSCLSHYAQQLCTHTRAINFHWEVWHSLSLVCALEHSTHMSSRVIFTLLDHIDLTSPNTCSSSHWL